MLSTPQSRDIYTIGRLNSEVRSVLDGSFPLLWVSGEISNLSTPRSGHIYLSLKDSHAQVRCALFRNKRQLLRFQPQNGDQVVVRAKIGFYEPRGDFQLIIEHMELAGDGDGQLAFEALKKKLDGEGLFSTENKQALPSHPKRIGIISSASGAAVHDVLKVLKTRAPSIPVVIYPCLVQGKDAPESIQQALVLAEKRAECDVLLLTRGGGSSEDLEAFNNESLARQIAKSDIPIISAIGHEIDFTISDFVADRRAPTPSAAAELVSPDTQNLLGHLNNQHSRIKSIALNLLQNKSSRFKNLQHRLSRLSPEAQLHQQQQRLDELEIKLNRQIQLKIETSKNKQAVIFDKLRMQTPSSKVNQAREQLISSRARLTNIWKAQLQLKQQHISALARQLNTVSPLSTLERGYAIVRKPGSKEIIHDCSSLIAGDKIEALIHQGTVVATVDKIVAEK